VWSALFEFAVVLVAAWFVWCVIVCFAIQLNQLPHDLSWCPRGRRAASPPSPALERTSDLQRAVSFWELDQLLRSAPGVDAESDRRLFWLYYSQGFSADEIAALQASNSVQLMS
jgi:hypothetical protein